MICPYAYYLNLMQWIACVNVVRKDPTWTGVKTAWVAYMRDRYAKL